MSTFGLNDLNNKHTLISPLAEKQIKKLIDKSITNHDTKKRKLDEWNARASTMMSLKYGSLV